MNDDWHDTEAEAMTPAGEFVSLEDLYWQVLYDLWAVANCVETDLKRPLRPVVKHVNKTKRKINK